MAILAFFAIAGAAVALAVVGVLRALGRRPDVGGAISLPSGRPRVFLTARRARPARRR